MNWFRQQSKIVEQNFAKHLKDVEWANVEQDMFEHWDLKGLFPSHDHKQYHLEN